jgi:hypothetical protein
VRGPWSRGVPHRRPRREATSLPPGLLLRSGWPGLASLLALANGAASARMDEPSPSLWRTFLLLVDVLGFLGLAVAPLLKPEDLRAQLVFGYLLAQPLSVWLAGRLGRFAGPQRRRYWAYVYRLVLLAAVLFGGILLDEVPKDLRADAEWLLHWVGRHSTEVEEMLACAVVVCRPHRPTSLRASGRACLTRRMALMAQSAALWIFLAPYSRGVIVPLSTLPAPWNPFDAFRDQQNTARAIVAVRVVGGATILPMMEEVRSLGIIIVHAESQPPEGSKDMILNQRYDGPNIILP